MQSIISRQGKGSKRESGAALMCCTKVNSSEHGRKCGVEGASVFQPVRQLQMMSWLLGDPLLPGCLLPPPCPCLLQHATMQGPWQGVGMATQCPAVSQCLWGDTGEGSCSSCSSPVSKVADAAWKRKMVPVQVKKPSSGAGISPAGDVTIPSCTMVWHGVLSTCWASRLKMCLYDTAML